jgi:hypothetical protein
MNYLKGVKEWGLRLTGVGRNHQSQLKAFSGHGELRFPLPAGERARVRGIKRNFSIALPSS